MAARKKISFATCNLLNLNLPGHAIYRDRDGWDPEVYKKKIEWSANTLSGIAADVWGFQELWHADPLEEIFDFQESLADYTLLVPDGHHGKIVCAGAVKTKILAGSPRWIETFPEKFILRSRGDDAQTADISVAINRFSRPVLHFKVKPHAREKSISVYVVHFKSKRPTTVYNEGWYRKNVSYYRDHRNGLGSAIATIRRTAEAAALRMILTDEMKQTQTPVVVLGDCNDAQLSNTLNILTEQPKYLLQGKKGGRDTALYSTGTLQEFHSLRDVYYTHIHNDFKESLDHILVSEELYDYSRNRVWGFQGMELVNDHLHSRDHKQDGTTDHGIVKAGFVHDPV